jgi:hypothetical protein
LAIGAVTVLAPTSASASATCFSNWVVTDTSASGFCNGGSNIAYKEKVKCTDGLWHSGNLQVGQGLPVNPLSTAYCPRNQFTLQTAIVQI